MGGKKGGVGGARQRAVVQEACASCGPLLGTAAGPVGYDKAGQCKHTTAGLTLKH